MKSIDSKIANQTAGTQQLQKVLRKKEEQETRVEYILQRILWKHFYAEEPPKNLEGKALLLEKCLV